MPDTDTPTDPLSEIQQYFNNKNIFITGATGFLGNLLLSKLITSCTGVKTIYVLMREKKGINSSKRFQTMFDGVVFEKMKTEQPDFLSKFVAIIGDCMVPNLGISEEDLKLLQNEVNIVFHVAATVNFEEPLRKATYINIRSTHDLLKIAKNMKNLDAFIHVSTAYSQCVMRSVIEEKFYKPKISPNDMMQLVELLDEDVIAKITPEVIKPWPNTYAFTKAIAEAVIAENCGDLPIAVFRPSIVIPTAKEPIPGWINNIYGPTGVFTGCLLGVIRTLRASGSVVSDVVPCDTLVNAMIAVSWDVSKSRKSINSEVTNYKIEEKSEEESKEDNVKIYNYVSSNSNPLTWDGYKKYTTINAIPMLSAIWTPFMIYTKYKYLHKFYCLILHILPAIFIDFFCKIIGEQPKMMQTYEKIHKFSDVISFFSTKQWKFMDSNIEGLWKQLTDKDKEIFHFHLKDLVWLTYFRDHCRGIRVYLLKESDDTGDQAWKKRNRFLVMHYILVAIICLCLFWFIQTIRKVVF